MWDGGSYLYIGGDFTVVNGQPRTRLARLDLAGNLDVGFAVTANKPVRDLAVAPDGTTSTWSVTSPTSTARPASGRPP